MRDNVVRFPVQSWKRVKNRRGARSVSCMVSDRWLSFGETAEKVDFGAGEIGTAAMVHVMTDAGGKPRRMCELVLTLEDLEAALKTIRVVNAKR